MFGFPTWIVLAVGLAIATATGFGAGWKTNGWRWEARHNEHLLEDRQKDIAAAATLQVETVKVLDLERSLAALNRKSGEDHAKLSAALAARVGSYNNLGKLYEQTKRRDASCDPATAGNAAAAGVDASGAGEVAGAAVVPGTDRDDFDAVANDADQLEIDFDQCVAERIALFEKVNAVK